MLSGVQCWKPIVGQCFREFLQKCPVISIEDPGPGDWGSRVHISALRPKFINQIKGAQAEEQVAPTARLQTVCKIRSRNAPRKRPVTATTPMWSVRPNFLSREVAKLGA
jgi:hypothetical protein